MPTRTLRYTHGYSRALLISHINGGVAGISKTRAIDTIESGPILGLYGACHLAKLYGIERVIALDVGGTTAKIGIVENGEPVYSRTSELFGTPVRASLPYLRSIALGGGSVATVTEGSVHLGPESMGSFPGPVCYALGGDKLTLTDAFVTAGLINPDYFLGGTKQLDLQAAGAAIKKEVSNPLGISKDDACRAIIGRAYEMVANMITDASRELGRDLSDHVLFAYGGNGGLFACGVAERAHLQGVFVFDLGPLFSAFGSSVTDISHVYERALHIDLGNEKGIELLNQFVEEMRRTGVRDLRGEAISAEDATFTVELELTPNGGANVTLKSSQLDLADTDFVHKFNSDLHGGEATLELVRLRVRKAIARPVLTNSRAGASSVDRACIGTRKLSYGSSAARVYKWELLPAGAEVEGPTVLESANSTYFVSEGWVLKTDQYGNARLSNVSTRSPQAVQTHGEQAHGK
jgi:acetophenone carboxylase